MKKKKLQWTKFFSFQLYLDSISSKGGLLTGEQQRGQRPAVNLGRFNLT